MLTDYAAHCPHEGCTWRGFLFPQNNREDFRRVGEDHRQVTFRCPRCQSEWQARIVHDDAINLPLPEAVTQA